MKKLRARILAPLLCYPPAAAAGFRLFPLTPAR